MSGQRLAFVCVHIILLIHVLVYRIASANEVKCEVLTIRMCKNLGYNTTYMPNRLNHESQKDAALEIDKFSPFVEVGCSPLLQYYLCSLYAPACDKGNITDGKELLPCRSVCENATAGCLKLMDVHGVKWPKKMESCDLWPRESDNKSCLSGLDTQPAPSRSSFTLTDKTRAWLRLKDKTITTVTLRNSDVSFLKLKNIIVTLMLLKNTSVSFFDLTDGNLNLLTFTSTSSVSHFTALNTILNSFKLTNTEVSHFTLTSTSLNSLTLRNTTVSHMTITNTSMNSFTLINSEVSHLTLTNTNMNSFTLINSSISFLTLTNTTMNSFTRTKTSVSWIRLTNSDLSSQPSTDTITVQTEKPSTDTITVQTEKPSTDTITVHTEKPPTSSKDTTHHSPTKYIFIFTYMLWNLYWDGR